MDEVAATCVLVAATVHGDRGDGLLFVRAV